MSKSVPCIHVDQLTWSKPEDSPNPDALMATADEFVFEIAPSIEKKGVWDWGTKRGSEILGSGEAKSVGGAKREAANVANRYRRERAKAEREAQEAAKAKAQEPEPETESPSPNAGEMFDAVEAGLPRPPAKRSRKAKAEQPEATVAA